MAKTTLTIVKTDGNVTHKEYEGTVPNYKDLQAAVGGFIETVPYFTKYEGRDCVAFCNDEGKNNGLLHNQAAQKLWGESFGRPITEDYLVGDIAIVWGDADLLRNHL